MTRDGVENEYFKWLFDLVCGKRYSKPFSYRKLLMHLHGIEFHYLIPKDANRAEDGLSLRWRFAYEMHDLSSYDEIELAEGPCSVLEMMIALAIRCEENIMDDPNIGNRTGQWFWGMIVNLGLGSMMDSRFDRQFVDDAVARFLNREYEPDGRGGLFTIRHCDRDLRDVEIWYQLCWYLDSIT